MLTLRDALKSTIQEIAGNANHLLEASETLGDVAERTGEAMQGVKFTMYVSVVFTVAVRLFLSYLLGVTLQMGVIGIALAMVCDGIAQAVLFIWREKSGRWKAFQVIES